MWWANSPTVAQLVCGVAPPTGTPHVVSNSSQQDVDSRRSAAAHAHQSSSSSSTAAPGSHSYRAAKFRRLLSKASVDLTALRELLWSGAPEDDLELRAQSWQMLLGYLPPVRERQDQGLSKKRSEWEELKRRHYRFEDEDPQQGRREGPEAQGERERGGGGGGGEEGTSGSLGSLSLSASAAAVAASTDGEDAVKVLKQIRVDIPRTAQGGIAAFSHPKLQRLMERVLYIWALRHPATGYVQGINDLLIPFMAVLLSGELKRPIQDIDLDAVDNSVFDNVEAGVYGCLSKVLNDIQDHYTSGQPGIQALVLRLQEIIRRIDLKLYQHLEEQGMEFLQFAFRWMNCLLLREFPLPLVIRLWDTYIAEPSEGFSTFHVYFCAVFLIYWSPQLKQMDFPQLMLFMQKLPTSRWGLQEIETLLAEAYVLKSLFHSSPKHLAAPLQAL